MRGGDDRVALCPTVTAAASAMASAIPEPMNRPRIPKNAPLDTVMLVPVRGPITAVGRTTRMPMAIPTAMDVTVCQAQPEPRRRRRTPHSSRSGWLEHRAEVAGRSPRLFRQVFDTDFDRACACGCHGAPLVERFSSVDAVFNSPQKDSSGR